MVSVDKYVKIAQFNFLKSKNYKLYGFQKTNFLVKQKSHYNSNVDILFASKKAQPTLRNFDLVCEINNQEELLHNLTQKPIVVENEEDTQKFFIDFLFSNLALQKTILKNHQLFIHNFQLGKYYKKILSTNKFKTINEFIVYFSKTFTNSFWSINTIDLNEMHKVLIKKWGAENTYKFWLKFLKSRKNQINDPKNSPKINDFIFSIYKDDRNKMLAFSNFFKYLKAKFHEPDIYIFEEDTLYSIHFSINLKNMVNSFFIDGYLTSDYQKKTELFCECLIKFHQFSHCEIFKRRNILSVNLYQYQNDLQETEIKDSIISFFKHLKENHVKDIEENIILKWLDYYYLNKSLKQKQNSNKKIMKI